MVKNFSFVCFSFFFFLEWFMDLFESALDKKISLLILWQFLSKIIF